MTLFISEYITITLAGIAVFFSLQLAARLMNAYLRWHDRLHISKEDRGQIVSTLTTALVFGALTFLSAKVPVPVFITVVLLLVVVAQLTRVNHLLTALRRHWSA